MNPQGVMPHPWWQFWQIGDFLVMLAIVVFFVRFVRRSDGGARSEPEPPDEPLPASEDEAAARRRTADGGAGEGSRD